MVFEDRIAYLKQTIKERNKFNESYNTNKLIEQGAVEEIEKMQKPVVEAIEKIDVGKIAPVLFDVDPKLPNSLVPKYIKGEAIQIHTTTFHITVDEGKTYMSKTNQKGIVKTYELTPTLKLLIEGKGDATFPPEEIKNYLEITKGNTVKYIQTLKADEPLLKKVVEPQHGQGIEIESPTFLPDNPIALFIELRKLLAAKKAGHNNVDNEVNAICKRLVETGHLTTDKYQKIIKKYFG